ncbi:phosphoglucomutase/phosphomannomutase family protein [bacterium 3DAC]|nr:phosphoglucomutase/phosphomannomutase family protein [bacterium 3DAC]
MPIKFGTDGWRDLIGFDYNAENIVRVSRAVSQYFQKLNKGSKVLIGYDNRFMSEEFAQVIGRVFDSDGYEVHIFEKPVPTPLLAWSVKHKGYALGIMLTASHNPHYYHGYKVIPWHGSPAEKDITDGIQALIDLDAPVSVDFPYEKKYLIPVPDDYLLAVKSFVGDIKTDMRIVYSAMHGVGAGFTDRVLKSYGLHVSTIRSGRDPYFGGIIPEPKPQYLSDLAQMVKGFGAVGLANDGDADRFGLVDEKGNVVNNNWFLAAIAWYLYEIKKMKGNIGRTVATTHMLNNIAKAYGYSCVETPVGFKWLGKEMREGNIFYGGEESGGLGIAEHVPEKDGVIADVMFVHALTSFGGTVSEFMQFLQDRFGPLVYERRDYHLSQEQRAYVKAMLESEELPSWLDNVKEVIRKDGLKVIWDDGAWLLIRLSGTEPVIRVYVEAQEEDRLEEIHTLVVKNVLER